MGESMSVATQNPGLISQVSTERSSRSGLLCAEAGTRAAAPFRAPLSPLAASFLRCASDRFLLTRPNTSGTIEVPASLRFDGVRDHPGMSFGFIPDLAFSFAGIPKALEKPTRRSLTAENPGSGRYKFRFLVISIFA